MWTVWATTLIDNTFGSIRLPVCLSHFHTWTIFLLARSGRYWYLALPSITKGPVKHKSATLLKKHHRVFISRSIKNGWAFKMVVVSTVCTIMVDHAFNVPFPLALPFFWNIMWGTFYIPWTRSFFSECNVCSVPICWQQLVLWYPLINGHYMLILSPSL